MKLFKRPAVRVVRRYVKIGLSAAAVILAVAIVGSLTVDLGPHVRELGERAGSKQIERPLHIGRLSIHLLTGRVVVEDLTIDGLHAGDRPFFTARHLTLSLDWSTAFRTHPEFTITAVEMTDWNMLVEKWDDEHNFPKFTRDQPEDDAGPPRFTSTLRVSSMRGGASSPTTTTRRRGTSSVPTWTSTSGTCRRITARRCSAPGR